MNKRPDALAEDADPLGLPAPEPHDAARSAQLHALIVAEIANTGAPMSFARYMELALYAPGLGFYMASGESVGADGHFVTAPEISNLFTACVAREVAGLLSEVPGGEILEVGAGSGVMAAGVLRELKALGCELEGYRILERSARLKATQRACITALGDNTLIDNVHWIDDFPHAPFRGVVLANELLDAIPIHRVSFVAGVLNEWCVDAVDGELRWHLVPCVDERLSADVAELQQQLRREFSEGYTIELAPMRAAWLTELAKRVQQGAVLLFDYGYARHDFYHPQRDAGTLSCHYRHRLHDDPLRLVGIQDISAHVEWTSLAECAHAAGMRVAGFTSQAGFLLGTRVDEHMTCMKVGSREHMQAAAALKQLMLPGQMGEVVKVMALTRNLECALLGFDAIDLRRKL